MTFLLKYLFLIDFCYDLGQFSLDPKKEYTKTIISKKSKCV